MARVEIALLGRFAVAVDGRTVRDEEWTRPPATSLVKLLALAPARRAHREQVMDALWPGLAVDEAAPRLHKAAHYARKALGERGRLTVRADVVTLCPADDVAVDAHLFEQAAQAALATDAPATAVAKALALYGGELLPHDLYEPWTEQARRHLGTVYTSLLRAAGHWEQLVALDPSDEVAQLSLMRSHAHAGDRAAALRQFERLEHALRHELGVAPGREALELRAQLLATDPLPAAASAGLSRSERLVGRRQAQRRVTAAFQDASTASGRTVLVHGVEGVGKSALLDWVREDATARGWRCGSGIAAEVEGAWPYAPVLEALADLARAHPTLMDALDDTYREEIERALGGHEVRWSGAGGRMRLFVAAAELLRVAAAGTGMVLLVDDVHEADEATLRLLHYLARTAVNERAVIVLAHRPASGNDALQRVRSSLLARRTAVDVRLSPLSPPGTAALLAMALGREPERELARQVHTVSAGVPRRTLRIARAMLEQGATSAPPESAADLSGLSVGSELRDTLRQVAVLGTLFDTDEFVAVAGLDDESAYTLLDTALAGGVLERTDVGFRMQSVTRDELLHDLPQHRLQVLHRNAANALNGLGASPARIGHHLLRAGDTFAAVPHILAAAETAAALGAHRNALRLVESVRAVAGGTDRPRLLRMRADLLLSVGDPGAVAAFREAVEAAAPSELARARARLAQAAAFAGDLDTAREALAGLDTSAETAELPVLLAKGNVAYFSGDLDGAAAASRAASERVGAVQSLELLDLVSLQGLVAHDRGEWFTRLYHELRRTKEAPAIATAVFDAHLCVAEYLLYGPTPYDEVIALATELRQTAERAGALRAVAFAATLVGEAALLSGDLAAAERELLDAVDLHHDIGAVAGEAHSLQRLAELRVLQGDRRDARALLRRALPMARWSPIAMHLLQRIHGTLIRAADDPQSARAIVDRADAAVGTDDFCKFCQVMFSVPAAIACAQDGDVAAAHRHLDMARRSAALWHGTAWEAATLEAEAHVAIADNSRPLARQLLEEACGLFEAARQPLDAARCRQTLADLVVVTDNDVDSGRRVPAARDATERGLARHTPMPGS